MQKLDGRSGASVSFYGACGSTESWVVGLVRRPAVGVAPEDAVGQHGAVVKAVGSAALVAGRVGEHGAVCHIRRLLP